MGYSYFYILKAVIFSSPFWTLLFILPIIFYIFIALIFSLLCLRNRIIFALCAFILSVALTPIVYLYTFDNLIGRVHLAEEYRKKIYNMMVEKKTSIESKYIFDTLRFSTTNEFIKEYSASNTFFISNNRKTSEFQKTLSKLSLIPANTDYFEQFKKHFVANSEKGKIIYQNNLITILNPLVVECMQHKTIDLGKETIDEINKYIDDKILECSVDSAEKIISARTK